jgi:hypothetical protein
VLKGLAQLCFPHRPLGHGRVGVRATSAPQPARRARRHAPRRLRLISLGITLGMALPRARSAQGFGLLLFFPFFLLGGAGPPPDAMGDRVRVRARGDGLRRHGRHVRGRLREPVQPAPGGPRWRRRLSQRVTSKRGCHVQREPASGRNPAGGLPRVVRRGRSAVALIAMARQSPKRSTPSTRRTNVASSEA